MLNRVACLAISRWREAKCFRKRLKRVAINVFQRTNNDSLVWGFHLWSTISYRVSKMLVLHQKVCRRAKTLLAASCVMSWHLNSRTQRRHKLAVLKYLKQGKKKSKQSLFSAWLHWCSWHNKVTVIAGCIIRRARTRSILVILYNWRATVRDLRRLKTIGAKVLWRLQNYSCASAFQSWMQTTSKSKMERQELEKGSRAIHCC